MADSASRYSDTVRRNVLLSFLALLALGLVFRLVWLQVKISADLKARGYKHSLRIQTEDALRGMILDREGEALAISTPVSTLILDPKRMWEEWEKDFAQSLEESAQMCEKDSNSKKYCAEIIAYQKLKECEKNKKQSCPDSAGKSDQGKILQRIDNLRTSFQYKKLQPLAELLNEDSAEFYAALVKRKELRYMYLARQISPSFAEEVMSLDIPGLMRKNSYKRFYPAGEIFGYIIGYTDIEDKGQEGLEKLYESRLAGQSGKIQLLQDIRGRALRVVKEVAPASPGTVLQLSIDKRIQFIAHQVLSETVSALRAKSATAVMVDVHTGEILAMVTVPSGNPNNISERRVEFIRNRAVTDIFEPGSTMKPLAVAVALEAGVITPHTVFEKTGIYRMGKNQIVRDGHNYGTQDTIGIIRKSSNVGMAKISERIPREKYYYFMQALGFGQPTGLDFPAETKGILYDSRKLNPFDFATNTYGYGISVSTLQMAHAYATLANNGVKMPLSLVKLHYQPEGARVISKKTALEVKAMLKEAVHSGGTGTRATMESYTVAGKTGTSHKVVHGKYSENAYYSVFAGFAPADNPRIAMAVMVDEPQGEYYGGLVAAPPFAKIAEWSLKILGVLPDKIAKADNIQLKINTEISGQTDKKK